ncbi:hypothetical protein MKW92_034581, partial [Papaver armeniacum]
KRNVGKIWKFVFYFGAEDKPIIPSTKAHLLKMLENYDNPEISDLFPDSDEDMCIGSLSAPQQKKHKKKRKN